MLYGWVIWKERPIRIPDGPLSSPRRGDGRSWGEALTKGANEAAFKHVSAVNELADFFANKIPPDGISTE